MSEPTSLAEVRAAKARAKTLAKAEDGWRKAVKSMGLNAVTLRSGLRAIREAAQPGTALNALVRDFQGRTATAAPAKGKAKAPAAAPAELADFPQLGDAWGTAEPGPLDLADPSDVLELAVRLRRKRGQGWYGSDPLGKALGRLDRDVAEGIVTRAEFERRAQQIATLPSPPKIAAQPVKLTPALEKTANAKGAEAALRAAGELKAGDLPEHLKNVKRTT